MSPKFSSAKMPAEQIVKDIRRASRGAFFSGRRGSCWTGCAAKTASLLDDPAGAVSNALSNADPDPNLPHDPSPWSMFMAADWVVKAVMIGLAFASLATWTIWLAKSLELAGAKMRASKALKAILSADTLEEANARLSSRRGPPRHFSSAPPNMRRAALRVRSAGLAAKDYCSAAHRICRESKIRLAGA